MEKKYNDEGEVGIIYSPNYGGCFENIESLQKFRLEKDAVEAVLDQDQKAFNVTTLGASQFALIDGTLFQMCVKTLKVYWTSDKGCFKITEFDGAESLEFNSEWTSI